ncbi:MAG TPA: hypothetical protein VEU76_07435 [Candidatus Udaeobacter sp.]|nr:hypothetical protein [Candidatus Udaeobacter sp.]
MRLALALMLASAGIVVMFVSPSAEANNSPYQYTTWWQKAQLLINATAQSPCPTTSTPFTTGDTNVDMSNQLTPQSETSIAINPSHDQQIVGGSNEIVCDPMRGYFSSDGGKTWGGVDLPLPAPITTNGQDFGSDPGVAWDHLGNVYYSYIVVFFNKTFHAVQGSEMAVARSSDGGQTWASTYFNANVGNGKFNDKPMITVGPDNTVYVAWDNASQKNGKSSANDVILVSRSTDQGVTFSAPAEASPSTGGPAAVIGADPFVSPKGTLYVAWQDSISPAIRVSASTDRGKTFGPPSQIAPTLATFQVLPPAQALRGALIYPACGADSRGRLYCSWSDATPASGMRIFFSTSDDGSTWSTPQPVSDIGTVSDQFNQWLAVDPTTGNVVVSWNDSRHDATRRSTEYFMAESTNRGASFASAQQVASQPTDETCCGANLGNQYGDYEGVSAFHGVVRPIWTDRRATVAAVNGLDEEVFTDSIQE